MHISEPLLLCFCGIVRTSSPDSERFGVSRASIHFADGQFLENSTQKMLPRLPQGVKPGAMPAFDLFNRSHTALLQAAGAVCYQVTPGTWVTGEPVPGVLRHERQQSLERVQDRPVVGQWFFRIVAPAELEVK